VGDWLPPHGKGKQADIRIRSNPKKRNPSEESELLPGVATLEMDFGDDGGVFPVTEKNGWLAYSDMKMPYSAPESGYGKSSVLKFSQEDYSPSGPSVACGNFIRVRTTKNGDRIVSSNYCKIAGDISYFPVEEIKKSSNKEENGKLYFGQVEFIYYFNPTPNDRNLEFDTEHNLVENPDEYRQVQSP
jgi:hypothetical protein